MWLIPVWGVGFHDFIIFVIVCVYVVYKSVSSHITIIISCNIRDSRNPCLVYKKNNHDTHGEKNNNEKI